APQLDLREDLALLGDPLADRKGKAKDGEGRAGVDFDGVARWGAAEPVLTSVWPRLVALVLGAAGLVAAGLAVVGMYGVFAGWGRSDPRVVPSENPLVVGLYGLFADWGLSPLIGVIFLDLIFGAFLFRRVQRVLSQVEKRARDLALLANVLAR